jgi:hypothetical protein
MRSIFSFLLVSAILVAACNNNKSKETTVRTDSSGINKEVVDQNQKAIGDIEKQKEELEKLSPVSADQLMTLVPETLMGATRINHEVSAAIGANVASGEYEINDSTRITLNIYDCAGPAGAGIYGLQFAGLLNNLHDNADEYIKSIDLNGNKAFEQCDKTTNDCTLSYFSGGRFLVTLQGDHVGADALKQAAGGLNIK